MSPTILSLLLDATFETFFMVTAASLVASLAGIPLGVLLYITRKGSILQRPRLYRVLDFIVNVTRSVPFIILMIAIIPFTRFIVGTSIGTSAAIVPLSVAAIPFVARVVENALLEVNPGLIEAGVAMGASNWQIILKILLFESRPSIINGLTLTVINLVGYSAMAGAVGGGGLGDLAVRYGYQRFDVSVMLITILIMVLLVQAIQFVGDCLMKRVTHTKI